MASYNEEFNQYRIFLENVAKSVVPQDSEVPIKANHLRNRISCHSDAEGEVIYWILKFLDEKKCPTKLIAPIVRNVLVEIQDDPQYKDPKGCPDFRGLATTVLEGFCIRLLDNVELNKILDTATSHSAQQQPNDDLLTIPIRTAAASQNKRRKMEDRSICIDEFHKVYAMKDSQKRSFYGVFDGHGGDKAAQYAASQLPFSLSQYADTNDKQIDALCDAFKYTDEKFLSKSLTSGTTATCTLYCPEEGRLYISWVGDSKAMLAKQHGKIIQLVTPHRPDLGKEKIRIRYLGGSIHFIGGEYRVSGCLNVTRSIGDIRHKKFLISEPDCVAIDLDKTEEFLVLATDGLWDYAAEVDIAKTVYDCIKEDCENIDQIPNRLIQLAQDRRSSDNILVVVIFFKQPSQIAKNCDNLTIMESQFDNIKEVGYYNSRNLYPSDENSTSNSHAIDAKQMRWSPNDNLNNIINEEVKQTTTTTTTTTSTTNNGQFDDNLLYSGDNIDLNQKTTLSPSDDNNLHHASTLENNGEEQLLGASFDNKNQHEQLTTDEFDNEQQRILEKNQPHQQQLGDTDADYGPETCVDVTDDVVMMTENSADTNNLLEQSVLSHSKDTLPSSDNCNPFDNKNTLDMEDGNEFQMGSGGVDAQLHLDDANKSTPLLSPEVEDLPLSSEGGMQYTNEGFQQSPMDEEIPVGIDSHQGQVEFEEDFMPRNGHLSPVEMKHTEEEKLDVTQKAEEEQEEAESLSKLERFGNVEEEKVNKEESNAKTGEDLSHQETDLDEEEYIGKRSESPVVQKENLYEHIYNAESDEADFRLKDEEEILEKHVEPVFVEKEHLEAESAVLDMSHRDELQQSLHNLEVDILEEKPILTGNILDNLSPLSDADEQKLNEFVEEKQDREEFSEKEDKVEEVSEKMIAVGQNGKNIELEEDECIHLEEDVRPSDYLAMVERQKLELEQLEKEQSEKVDNQLAEEARQSLEHTQELLFGNYQEQGQIFGLSAKHEAHLFEDDDRLSDKVEQLAREKEFEKDERLNEREQFDDEKLGDGEEYKEHFIDEQFNDEEEEPFVSKKVDEKFELEEESYDEKFDQEEKEQLPVEKAGEKLDAEEDLYSEKFDKEEKEELPVEKIDEVEKEQLPAEDVVEEPIEKAAEKLEAVDEKIDEVEKELPPIESAPELLQELVNQLEKPAKELVEEICEQVEQVYSDNNELVEQVEELEREKQDKADEKLDKQIEQIEQNEHYDIDDSFTQATEQLEQQRHLDDIEIMGQQNDRFEKEDQAEQLDDQLGNEQKVTDLSEIQEQAEPSETLNEKQNEELESEQTQVQAFEETILGKEIDSFPKDNKYQSEEQPLSEEISPVLDESIAQPEKQCFEEPEKTVEEIIPQQNVGELVLQTEEPITSDTLPISPQSVEEETENKLLQDGVEEIEKQLEEVNEKVLSKIENQILDLAAPLPKPRVSLDKPVQEYDEEPEELVEVEEPLIIKEQVPIKPSALSVTSQEPSAVPPTHESCDESEDDEWKYMKEGQGEKQLLGLQGDIVLEEEIQQQLQEESTQQQQPEAKLEQQPLEATTLTEEVITKAPDQIETIKDTFESLTQNIAELAENAAAPTESVVDKIGDTLENLNLSQSSTREKLDNIEDDEDILASEMNSKLNPEAKEFIPTFSPTAAVEFANGLVFGAQTATAIPHHFKDDLIAQSPRKGRESNMENINIPAENEFDEEIAHKPHGLPGDEIIIENAENGGLYQEMNWKEAMHGSEKEEGPLVDSPVTEESLEVVENVLQYGNAPNLCDFSAPVGLDNAGMKESIYIENNTSAQSNEEDVLNTVQVLPVDSESQENSLETENKEEIITPASENAPIIDVVTDNQVQEILTLAGDEKKEEQSEENIEKRMEELLLSHDREITKDVPIETEQVPINGVEMSPTKETPSTPDESSPAVAAIALGTAAAVAVAATTTAVKKAEAEKNQKNLNKTSSATKSKVPDTKKPTSGTASKVIGSSTTAKRSLGEKPKPSVASSVAIKKTTSTTTTAAPRPRTAPSTVATKTIAEKKTTTTTTSTAKSRIDTKPPITLAARKPLTSTATKTSSSKPGDDAKSSNTTVKSSISGKPLVGSKTSVGSAKPLSAANSITKTRPATASAAATTNGSATKTAASKPTTLAPKSAGHTKPSLTSPRGTLTSSLRKTEAIKSPVKTTTSTAASRTSLSTNGTKTTTTTRTTTTTKTLLSTVPATAAKSTTGTTTTTRRTITSSGTSSTVGATTPTSKTPNNLVSRKSTPLKKTTSTPTARKSIGSKLNASATKPTKDTTTPRPVTIPPQHQNNNNSIVEQVPKVDIIPLVVPNDIAAAVPLDNGEPKLNGVATPDDLTSPTAPVAQSLVEIA